MKLNVAFTLRDFSADRQMPARLEYQVERYSKTAFGGCKEAVIRVTGPDLDLWETLELIRCPVTITDDKGESVWWGYVNEATVTARNPFAKSASKTRVGASLDSMFNRVAVAWEDIVVGTYGGERYTTAWAANGESTMEYGYKEGLYSGESASDQTLAEQARDTLLEQHKYPIPIIEINQEGDSDAILVCRGWWSTLSWKYANVALEQALGYTTSAVFGEFAFGTTTVEKVAQAIDLTGGDIDVVTVQVWLRKVGTPADNVTIALYSNPDDMTPTTLLATSSTVAGGSLTTSLVLQTFTFSPTYTLTSATSYFMVLERSGAADDTNYYEVGIDPFGGYALGPMVTYNGTIWQPPSSSTDYDWIFTIYTNVQVATSTQILNMLTTFGQFIRQIEMDVSSGVISESFRDGDGNAQFEIEQLMAHGTTNNRRMVATVDEGRRCLVEEEPEQLEANIYYIHADGSMFDTFGAPVRKSLAVAGVWARLVDVIPPSVDSTFLGNAMVRFLETTEYDVVNDKMIYTARDEINPFELGRPYDG